MVKIYARKIKDGAINPKTNEAWKVEDVPEKWREAVQLELDAEGVMQ